MTDQNNVIFVFVSLILMWVRGDYFSKIYLIRLLFQGKMLHFMVVDHKKQSHVTMNVATGYEFINDPCLSFLEP
jgi:hypothetical protein